MWKEFHCTTPYYVYIGTYILRVVQHCTEKPFAQRHTTYIYIRIIKSLWNDSVA